MRWSYWYPLALGVLLLAPRSAAADDYYMIVFGSQRPIFFEANHTHTFAHFVRTVCDDQGTVHILERISISWMPQSMKIRVSKLRPEPGANLDLLTTLNWALSDGQRVSRWGPFRIEPELYRRAVARANQLNSGSVRYKALDTGFPTDRVSNCIHGVGDLAQEQPRLRVGTPTFGQSASYFVTLKLGDWIINPAQTHEWLMSALGLQDYPIVLRHLDNRNPTQRPVLRTAQSLLRLGIRQNLRRD